MTIYKDYYVYAYINQKTGLPYYIGKGRKNRAYDKHVRISVPKNKKYIVILEKNLTNVGACAIERRLIRWYGKKVDNTGILLNIANGGEGGIGGFMVKPENINNWKNNISDTNKKKNINFVTNGATEAARLKNTGKTQSDDHKHKRALALKKEIEIEGILYSSGKEASNILGFKPSTISSWVKKNNGCRYNIKIPLGSNQYIKR